MAEKMMIASVDRINNPKSKNDGMWYVSVSKAFGKPMELVFMGKSKKACIEYAKGIADSVHVSNGIDYGAKW